MPNIVSVEVDVDIHGRVFVEVYRRDTEKLHARLDSWSIEEKKRFLDRAVAMQMALLDIRVKKTNDGDGLQHR